ncbi:hypothetical protein [Novosphingobium sp.]|uniref:hypothetical protein n=1 Tax=Novosphingobium sp. TaxID=1874826 RepID=UPI0035B361D0
MDSAYLAIAATSLSSVAIITLASLKGWQGWLALKSRELEMHRPEIEGRSSGSMARIEIADLKERIRKLEAIAAGVDL